MKEEGSWIEGIFCRNRKEIVCKDNLVAILSKSGACNKLGTNINLFTATGRIYTSQKRPSRWPRTYIRPTSISFLRICQSPATDVVVVACLRGVFFVSSLIAACSLGPCSLRKQFFYASRGFCPNGGKQRCGCSQMQHKLVRSVRLMAFMTTTIEEKAGFVLLKVSATGMTVEIGWELGETGDGGAWWKKIPHRCCVWSPALQHATHIALLERTDSIKKM